MKMFKKILATVLCVIMVFGSAPLSGLIGLELPEFSLFTPKASAATYSGTCGDNLTWSFDESTGELVISGTGAMKDYTSYSSVPWYSIRLLIKSVSLPDGLTSIDEDAFYNCDSLTSITIPDSVTRISRGAFRGCTSLESITLPFVGDERGGSGSYSDVFGYIFGYTTSSTTGTTRQRYRLNFSSGGYDSYCYYIPSSLKTVVITDETVIPFGAFDNCRNFTSISIPDGVTSIGNYAFYNCTGLTSVTIPDSVTSISGAFSGCTGLTSITLPDSVTSISNSTFSGCTGLNDVYYTGDIEGWCAIRFSNSTDNPMYYADNIYINGTLVSGELIIPDSITKISSYAFYNFTGITNITIHESVTSIGVDAFRGCTSLESISADEANEYYSSDEYGVLFNKDKTELIQYPAGDTRTRCVIPDSVTKIGSYAFYNCTGLASITIPDSVTSIGVGAFRGCISLESITLPFVGYERGGSGSYSDVFGYIFGYTSSSETGTTYQRYASKLYDCNYYYIPSSLKTVVITDETLIPYGAFCNCSSLTSITLPDSVTSIGDVAFSNCTSLESAYYPGTPEDWSKITLGSNNSDLTDNLIFKSASERPYYAFGSCGENLAWKLYADGELEISGTGAMTNYTSSSTAPWYSKRSKITSVSLPYGLTIIGNYAFSGCTGLTSITNPDSITSIGDYAFSGCTGLTSITNPDSITSIGDYAFSGCTGLTSITLPDSVISIGDYAFSGCTGLTSITLPDSVISIGDYVFSGCTGITSITVPTGVTSISSKTFSGFSNIQKITFKGYDVSIEADAFDGCNANLVLYCKSGSTVQSYAEQNGIAYVLTDGSTSNCVIQNNVLVSYVGDSATPVIPNSVTSIGANAFKNNSSAESVEVPYSVTSIFSGAFANCASLERVIIPHTVTTIAANAFDSTDATIVCFANSYAHEYAVANGINFELITVELSETEVILVVGQNSTIIATPVQNYVSDVDVTWEIENEDVATVSEDGVVTALASGITTLNALAPNGEKLATCSVTVTSNIPDEPGVPVVPSEPDKEDVIKQPTQTIIKYGDAIILHVDASKIPEGGYVEWTADNGNFSYSANGETCTITPSKSGDTTFTATVYDENGNEISKDTQTMKSKAGFFDKFVAFFRKLFGMTKIIQQAINF